MTLKKNKVKLAEKRPLEDKGNESASKKTKAKTEQKAPKIASKKSEATKMGQKCENITIRPSTPESNFVNGDKSVPKGWKISSHKEEDGRSWVICPQVRKYQNQLTNHNWTSPQIPNPIHLCRYIFLLQGQKYKSRRAAFKSLMEKDNLPSNEKDQMLKCLSLEVGDCNYGRNIRIFNFSSGLDITR